MNLNSHEEFDISEYSDLDFSFNWASDNYLQTGENITSSTWVLPSPLVKGQTQILNNITSVFISGAVKDNVYRITNIITTSNVPPRTDSRTFVLTCQA